MHIPDGMMQGQVCPVTAVVSAVGVGAAAWWAYVSKEKPRASSFAAITTFIFAAQMNRMGRQRHIPAQRPSFKQVGTQFRESRKLQMCEQVPGDV